MSGDLTPTQTEQIPSGTRTRYKDMGDGTYAEVVYAVVDASGGSEAVTIADGADETQGAKADAAWNGATANPTIASMIKGFAAKLIAGSIAVTGTFWQATQPVTGTFFQATQPVSGTVTANVGTGTQPISVAARTNDTSAALEKSRVVKASAGNLRAVSCVNNAATTKYLQVHNTTSLPADGQIPVCVPVPIPAGSAGSLDYGIDGRTMSVGITVVLSSTLATLTITVANDAWFDCQFS